MRTMTAEYALYKGEELLCMGTAGHIAKEMNVTIDTVYWWHSPTNRVKRAANKLKKTSDRKYLVKLDDDDDDEE